MDKKPRNPKESFFSGGAGIRAIIGGTLIGTLTLAAFYLGMKHAGDGVDKVTYGRTMAFIVLTFSQLFYSLSMRNTKKTIIEVGIFGNKFLLLSIMVGILLQIMIISTPFIAIIFKVTQLNFFDWDIVMIFSLIPFVVNEIIKILTRRKK